MKQKLIEALTTKFEGVDANIISRVADNLMSSKTIQTEDDVNSVVAEVAFQDILKSYGDSRATEASKSAVSNYEKKYKLKDSKAVEAKKPDDDDDKNPDKKDKTAKKEDDETPARERELIEAIAGLKAEIDAIKKGKVADTRREKFNKAIEKLTEVQKKAYARTALDSLSDEDFDSLMTDVETEVAELIKDNSSKNAAVQPPIGGIHRQIDKKEASDKEVNDVVDKLNI